MKRSLIFLIACVFTDFSAGFTVSSPSLQRGGLWSSGRTRVSMAEKNVELGIRATQLLLDPRRRGVLVNEISAKYPVVPKSALEPAVTLVGETLEQVAPGQLQKALSPGGLEEVRPQIRSAIIKVALNQPVIQSLPVLSNQDKGKLLGVLVDLALDELLKDADWVLSSPETRLEALEKQIKMVRQEMGMVRLWKYRIKRRPVQYAGGLLAVTLGALVLQSGSVSGAVSTLQAGAQSTWKVGKLIALHVAMVGRYLGRQAGRLLPA